MRNFTEFETVTPRDFITIDKLCTTYAYVYSPSFNFRGESHEAWEIVYISKGTAIIETDEKTATISNGQFYIHKPFDFHKIRANNVTCNIGLISFTSKSAPLYEIADIVFDATIYQKNLFTQIISEGLHCLAGINGIPSLLESETPEWAGEQVFKNLLELFLIDVLRISKSSKAQTLPLQAKNDTTLIQNVKFFLAKNITQQLTLKEISQAMNYSVSYLCSTFKKATGVSIMNYFIRLRIERAKNLITDGRKTIKEISEELNFDTPQYFSYQFKKHIGIPPSQYANVIKTYKVMDRAQRSELSLLLSTSTEN